MITARPKTYVYMLLELLSVVGEYPTRSLSLLGNERTIKALIHRCESEQRIRIDAQGKSYSVRLFRLSGHGKQKTLRLCKEALPLIKDISPEALCCYLESFREHHFTGNELNIDRNHRIAEAVAMCKRIGAEFRPSELPKLQTSCVRPVIDGGLHFYSSRYTKRFDDDDMNKAGFTRATGLLFTPDRPFVVYNARAAVMKWSGTGEFKAYYHYREVVSMNSEHRDLDAAILFANDGQTAIDTLKETNKANRLDTPFSSIYRAIHFVPLDASGIRLLRLLAQPNFRQRLIARLIPEQMRTLGRHMSCDCDGEANGHYIFSHLDSDIARLLDFINSADSMPVQCSFEIVCHPWQAEYVSALISSNTKITLIAMEALEAAMRHPKEGDAP